MSAGIERLAGAQNPHPCEAAAARGATERLTKQGHRLDSSGRRLRSFYLIEISKSLGEC